jgi:GNAT superfamily N-acetyltransferase
MVTNFSGTCTPLTDDKQLLGFETARSGSLTESLVLLSITQATIADLETLFEMMRHMQLDDPWEEPFHAPTVRANLAELLQNPVYGVIYLVREDSVPIGYLVICFDYSLEYRGKGAWIDELFVEPAHREKGIGTQLLDLADRASREHQAKVIHLEVNHGNPAIELYRRRGFSEHHRFLMSKPLDR